MSACTSSSPPTRANWNAEAPSCAFSAAELALFTLPDWEVLPYDLFSPHPDITSERLRTLCAAAASSAAAACIVAADTPDPRLPPPGIRAGRAPSRSRKGDRFALSSIPRRLMEAGYASVGQVTGPGEFAVRGSLLDVFPMGARYAVAHRSVR